MRKFIFAFAMAALLATLALAQATTGSLRGSVVDANGNFVANANVKIKNESTGITTAVVTDSEGSFSAASLLPGSYTITTELAGFKRSVKTGVQVALGVVTSTTISLETGAPTETVIVTASGDEVLQTEQSQVSGTIDTRRVEELPSNGAGGGIDTLALLIPGVVGNRTGGTNTNGTGLSVNGNRGRSNNFQIDGEDNNDLTVGGPALFVDFQDSVQEFQVITTNFSAQYGRNQGAVVNIVTKTGTNQFHGSGFWFHRDAYNFNSLRNTERRSGQLKPARDLYNVFGGTIGGPLWGPNFGENDGPMFHSLKDKAFFFFGYQGIREPSNDFLRSTSLGILASEFPRLASTYPTSGVIDTITKFSTFALPGASINTLSTAGQTTISSAFNLGTLGAGCPRVIAVGTTPPAGCGTYTAYINPTTGQPFLTGGPYDVINLGTATTPSLFQAAQYQHQYNFSFNENYWQVRFDVRPTNRDNASFRYIKQTSASKNSNASSNGFFGDLPASSKNLGGNWTHQFSNSIVNDFRASSQKIGVEFGGGCEAKTPGCIPGPAQLDVAFANIAFSVTGITKTTSALGTIGQATNLPQGRIGKVHQFADTLTWIKGRHSLMFGFEYKKLDNLVPFLPNFAGAYSYNSAIRITNNAPSGVSIAVGDPLLAFKENDEYAFFQDDFKIRPNLTLNLGVRYEYTGQPINLLHDASVARESGSKPLFNPTLPLSIRTNPVIPADKNNFAPRIGFAWSPNFWKGLLGENATVIRGGYSIAYEPAFYNILLNVSTNAPFAASLAVPATSLTSTAPGQITALPVNPYGDIVRANAAATGLLPTGVLNPIYLATTNVADDFKAPYSEQWSLGMQRQIGRKNIFEVRYVGTHGVGLFQNINNNFFIRPLVSGFALTKATASTSTGGFSLLATCPAVPVAGQTCTNFPSFASLLPSGTVAQTCVNDPATLDNEAVCDGRQFRTGGVTTRKNTAQSIYHSLQSRYNGRFLSDSLSMGATYTWSKSLDDASEIFAFGGGDISSPNAQNPFCINRCERGLSSFDRTHVFTTNFVYDVPFMKEQRGFFGRVLGGWQLNGIYILSSGSPYTPSNGGLNSTTLGLGATYLTAGDRPFLGNPGADQKLVAISQVDAFYAFGFPIANANGFWSMNSINAASPSLVAVTPNDVRFIINGPGAARLFGTPYGSAGRSILRGPLYNNLNLSLFKNIRITETLKVQLRAEAFNALNHPNPGFGTGSGNALPTLATTNAGVRFGAFGDNTDIALARRTLQLALRITF